MQTSEVIYQGELRTRCTHILSATTIFTDAPLDNEGKGECFSPTDLVATALASCMLTIIGIVSKREGFDISGTKASITKIMGTSPRRIQEVVIDLYFPKQEYTSKQLKLIEHSIQNCPVAKSLHPDIKQTIHTHF